jgi:pimeloyl-ACP methyl ester carboxylesterase
MTSPELRRIDVGDVAIAAHEWTTDPGGRLDPVLLAHATGFHGRCWDRVIDRLGDRRKVAVDLRGHGQSGKHSPEGGWRTFGEDLARVAVALDLRDAVGVGHSMGGHAMVIAAALEPGRFRRLVLIDPVIVAPEEYVAQSGARGWPLDFEHPTARRRDRWSSPEEMLARFRDRTPYSAFAPEVLDDYCRHGLLPAPDGDGCVLACPPAFEANVYMTARQNDGIYSDVAAIAVPVLVVRVMAPPPDRGMMDFRYSPTWPGLAARFRRGREVHLPERTHFFPMEDPALAARLILEDER